MKENKYDRKYCRVFFFPIFAVENLLTIVFSTSINQLENFFKDIIMTK